MQLRDDDLLQSLHDGVFELPLWSTFLDRLRTRAGARHATLVFRPSGDEPLIHLSSGEAPPPHLKALLARKFEPTPLPFRDMREGRVYALDELIDPNNPHQQAFQRELIIPWGMSDVRTVRVSEPTGVHAWLSCAGREQMGAGAAMLLSGLVPHLRTSLRIFAALERERFRSEMTTEALRRLNFGWLTLDAQCRIVDMAPHMEQLFQRSSVLKRGRYDRLMPASPALDRSLTALVKLYAADPDARPTAMNLSRDPQLDMLLRPIKEHPVPDRAPPVAIAYIRGDRLSNADRCEQLAELFGLLPSEARLAWAIAQGMSLTEAAEELGLTIETTRNYSKRIYAKTGSRGQAELVRNILTSVLALA